MTNISLYDILTNEVQTTSINTSLIQVLNQMERHNISCIVVTTEQDRRPLGIFTEQDVLQLIADQRAISELSISDVMSTDLLTTNKDLGFRDAYRLMSEHSFRHLIVTDDAGALLGLVSEADFMHHMSMEYMVELKMVGSAMSEDVVTLDPSASLEKAVQLMVKKGVSCIVICENRYPVGIITERDIVHLAQTVTQNDGVIISDIMQTPVISCQANLPIQDATYLMAEHSIRRLVVTHIEGKIAGLITRHDVVKTLQGSYIEYLHDALARINHDLSTTRNVLQKTQQKDFLLSLVEQIDDAIYIIDINSGHIIETNDRACKMLGYSRDELRSMMAWDISIGFSTPEKWQELQTRLKIEGSLTLRTSHHRRDGTSVPVEISSKYLRHEEQDYALSVARDMTERDKQMARQRLYATLFENAHEGVMVTDSDGVICTVNSAFTNMTGYTESEVLGKLPNILQSGKHDDLFYKEMWREIKLSGHWRGEIWNRRKNGDVFPELLSISSVYGETKNLQYYVGIFSDISRLKETEAKLEHLAHHDPLTQLANRRLLISQLQPPVTKIAWHY